MKYYLIFERATPGCCCVYPTYIVEKEEVAKDFCKEYPHFYYNEQFIDCSEDVVKCSKDEQHDVNSFIKGLYYDVKCPYCGKSHFQVGHSMTTAMYNPIVVKDGQVITNDFNVSTTEFLCLECGMMFKTVNGKVMKYE